MTSKVFSESPKNCVISFGSKNQLIEDETEKKATQTIYARLKQVSLF